MKNKLLRLVKKGKSTREMAEVLGISQSGVRYQLKKYGLRTERKAGRPSTKSLQTKEDFLGMPWGTASNRLRRLLLFKYVKLANGYLKCWDCGKEIEDASQLSMQHKKPWLHEDLELFWDLDNVTFSHRKCNKPDRNRNAEKTHCPAGHEYTPDNVRFNNKEKTHRICKTCARKKTRERTRKARAENSKYGR